MPDKLPDKFYITTPIYYVNDRPHIGHVYTTTVADVFARYHRLRGDETFFLTGTDEHAAKVVDAAAERDLSPQQWADRNADAFKQTFTRLGMTHDDFIRTSEPRHTERVQRYVKALMDAGEIYLGEYEGWYDPGQEEYVPESKAKETNYKSAINGRELVRRKEHNYFFRLSAYADELLRLLESGEFSVQPEARRNEVIARIRDGLNDVPISRSTTADRVEWGIKVPGDETHTIYVWIDALFNYLTTVDTDDRRQYWPADIHFIAKDILWFHAVIWPAVLTALQRCEGYDWVKLPTLVYAHSFWIAEGQKMSKSLGNFIDLERIDGYVETFGLDALRYFLASNGPMGTNDSDFAEAKFIDVYNSDLANTVGNCFNRIVNMTNRYFDGEVCGEDKTLNETSAHSTLKQSCEISIPGYHDWFHTCHLDEAVASAIDLIREIDAYIERTQPFKLAKDESRLPEVGTILYNCAEAMRIASLLLWPVIPGKIETMWRRMGCAAYADALAGRGRGKLDQWTQWGQLQPGTVLEKGDALFPRHQAEKG